MFRSLSLALMVALLITACGKDKRPSDKATSPSDTLSSNKTCDMVNCQKAPAGDSDNAALNDTQKAAKNASVLCPVGTDCLPAVGMLSLVIHEDGFWNSGQCTASLVAPDLVVTNGHCIPPDLTARGSPCRDRLWITFPKDLSHPEYDDQIACDTVVAREKGGEMSGADYAVLKLRHASNRPPLRLSPAGFADGQAYSILKVNPVKVPGATSGNLERALCHAQYRSALFPGPLTVDAPTMLLTDCAILPGNSGSPLFAADGSVPGVIYAFLRKDQLHDVFDQNDSALPAVSAIANLNVGTNFACLELPSLATPPPTCAQRKQRLQALQASQLAERVASLQPSADQLLGANSAGHPDILAFHWELHLTGPSGAERNAVGIPACVHPELASPLFTTPALPYRDLRRPEFSLRAKYDPYFRTLSVVPDWTGFREEAEQLKLAPTLAGAFEVEVRAAGMPTATFLNPALAACPL